jgi:surface antigen
VKAALALVLAVAAVAGASAQAARPPVTNGYPYASRCPAAGVADTVDRWRMDMCNCTSYVAWALAANGQRTDWFVAGAMDAWNWPHVAELKGLRVGLEPAVGAVAVWPKLARPFGHVAYVTAIERDGGIDVSEYNAPGASARFEYDARDDVSPAGAVFIYVPRTAAAAPT